ncbi:MAG: primosomal protein N' [Acidobacteria bacterium]|nr:primosomal protein N' [Acidobacteriota bacterium]
MSRIVSVAVPVPALEELTYRWPEGAPAPVAGARVDVPLGSRRLTGIVVAADVVPDPAMKLREVLLVRDTTAFVPPALVTLAAWVADYYVAGPGDVLTSALPPRVLKGDARTFKRRRVARLTALGGEAAADAATSGLPPSSTGPSTARRLGGRQREALALLAGAPAGLAASALASRGVSSATLARLVGMGLAMVHHETIARDPFLAHASDVADTGPPALTGEQRAALDVLEPLADLAAYRVALLKGVTGSGKTEIYLALADRVRRQGRQALLLVPEIALTPALAGRVRARFGDKVAIQHSGLSDGERHDQWHRVRSSEVDVVVGTRSAVFAPFERVGLIVVDEEHDTSYKQDEAPRYHGRDVAIVRGKQQGALVVLGSATPSLESYHNAVRGRYTLVSLDRRVADRPMADVHVVNMRDEWAAAGADVTLSGVLVDGIERRLAAGEQALVLLNRRGISSAVLCRQCGNTIECPHCSVSMTVHGSGPKARARCHYCDFARAVPVVCPQCAAPYLEHLGVGTERVEQELRTRFPGARIGRVDRDTVSTRGSLTAILASFGRRELDLLVGTQMIAKGHDFPFVTLVGVVSADVGLGLPDFRAAERTFQLITQVVGRAGRGDRPGEACVQTFFPTHYAVQCGCAQDYGTFVAKELEFRTALRYPPVTAMINVVVRGSTLERALDAARALAREVTRAVVGRPIAVLGPAPAPLMRLRGEHRAQFFLKGGDRAVMNAAIRRALAAHPALARRTSVDVDPVSML